MKWSLILVAAASLSACAAAQPAREASVPPSAGGVFLGAASPVFSSEAPPDDWRRLFADPTLDALVAQALEANTDLRIASANLARVKASLSAARVGRLPSTTSSASYAYGRQAASAIPGATGPLDEAGTYSAGLDVAYEIDLFGRVGETIAAAQADVAAAEAVRDTVRIVVAGETARAYADACAANVQIAVAERTVGLQQKTLELTERLLKAGSGDGLDVARAGAALEAGRAALPPLRATLDEAVFRLAALTGRTPAQASPQARDCDAVPEVSTPIPVGDGAGLLARRPDVRQAERELAAASARVGVATASLYPRVMLGGSLGTTASEAGDLGDDRALRFSIGPLISWSFPNIAAARAQVSAAGAEADAALARFDGVVLTALKETETALSAYAQALDRRAALQAARDRSAEAARLARLRFDAGLDSFLTVLDAERTLAAAQAQLAQSQAEIATRQVTLFRALGGGWGR